MGLRGQRLGEGNSVVGPSRRRNDLRLAGGEGRDGGGGVHDALGQSGNTGAGHGGTASVSGDENVTSVSDKVTFIVSSDTGSDVVSALGAGGTGVQLGGGGLAYRTLARGADPECGRTDVTVGVSVRESGGQTNVALSGSLRGLVGSSFKTKEGLGRHNSSGSEESGNLREQHWD